MNGLRHFTLLGALGVLAACGGGATPEGRLEAQGLQAQWLSNWASVGGDCQATFTRNPAVIKTVDNVYIKVVGPIGTVPDPGRWYVHSPTLSMASSAGFGVHGTNFVSGNEYYESNTSQHDGPFVAGTWTVVLTNLDNVPCPDYDGLVKVVFTLV